MSNAASKNIGEKELGIANLPIKIHILQLSIFLNLFSIYSTKWKSILLPVPFMLMPTKQNSQNFFWQNKSKKNQYVPSFSLDDQFAIDVKNNKDTIATIEDLFLKIRYRSSSREKAVYETCKFFMHSVKNISFKNRVAFYEIKKRLSLFQALEIFLILQIEVNIYRQNKI